MDENLVDNEKNKANNEGFESNKKTNENEKKETVKVPKKATVVFIPTKTELKDTKLIKELEKQKVQAQKQTEHDLEKQKKLEKQKEQEFKKEQKESSILEKKKRQEQVRLQKLEQKEQLRLEKQAKKEQLAVLKQTKKPKIEQKDYGLNDLSELENRILNRKETESEKRKRIIIIILSVILVTMLVIGSCTAKRIIDDQKPQPVEVKIEIDVTTPDPSEWENPPAVIENEDGTVTYIVYPGDTIEMGFYVLNSAVTESFPVYVRFRAYIVLDELTEHSVFIPHFVNEHSWLTLTDENGEDLDIDDWYYYAGAIPVGVENKIQIIDKLKLRTDLENEYQGKDFTLKLEIQAIEGSEKAAREIFEQWWLAPEEWYDHMEENNWYEHLVTQNIE